MNIANIFKELHGTILKKDLVSIEKVENYQDLKEAINYLEVPFKNIYFNPRFVINPYIYYSEYFILDIMNLDVDFLQRMNIKETIQKTEERFQSLIEKKDFESFFMYLDKRIIFEQYKNLYSKIPDEQKYPIFIQNYTRAEYGFSYFETDFVKDVFSHKKSILGEEFLEDLVDECGYLTIYRGEGDESTGLESAYSWTLKESIAEFFASRFDSYGNIYQAKIKKENVFAYIKDRGEEEIIALPQHIKEIKVL